MAEYKIMFMGIVTEDFYELMESTYFEEMGLCSIAAYLRKYEYEVNLVQIRYSEIDYAKIQEYNPDLISFVVYDMNIKDVLEACKKVKTLLPDTKICLGGFYATYNDRTLLEEYDFIDYVVRGEGEKTTLELVQSLEAKQDISQIEGISFRKDGQVFVNKDREFIEDLDEIPFMARDLIKTHGKKSLYKGSVGLKTSRGCIGKCTFCGTYEYWKVWRGRKVELVLDEIQELVENYDARKYWIFDQSFEDPHISRLSEIVHGIIQRNLDISYYCYMRAGLYKKVDDELMQALKRSGLSCVCIGIESGNDEDLKLYGKRASIIDNEKCLDLLQKWRVPVDPGFINFNPYSTFEKLHQNVDFLEKYGYCCQPTILLQKFLPYTGTNLAEKIMEDNLFIDNNEQGLKEYRFKDERIGWLYDFLVKGDSDADLSQRPFHLIRFNNVYDYLMPMTALENYFEKKDLKEELTILREFDDQFEKMFSELNERYADCFRALLQLAENNWNEQAALTIIQEKAAPEVLKELENKIIALKKKMIVKLARKNVPVENFF